MDYADIKFNVQEGVATIVLNSPKNLNALTGSMVNSLIAALDSCAEDPKIKAVIIAGEGNSFSAGGDIRMMLRGLEGDMRELQAGVRNLSQLALRIRNLRKPVIAAVHGNVAGAGVNLALTCDFRIAADNLKFIQAFVNIGLVPDCGGTFLLTRMLGIARATELIMTGRPVAAQEALELGLVNQVVPLQDLDNAAREMAVRFTKMPGQALSNMKALLNRAAFYGFENFLENEIEYQIQCSMTKDFTEGIRAFVEKRKPVFRGE